VRSSSAGIPSVMDGASSSSSSVKIHCISASMTAGGGGLGGSRCGGIALLVVDTITRGCSGKGRVPMVVVQMTGKIYALVL
jgi:hypothetical protein